MFVSESKFQAHPAVFIPLIKNRDASGLEALITKPEVERALLARLRKKATLYARELGLDGEPIVVVSALPPEGEEEKKRLVKPVVVKPKPKPKLSAVNGNGTTNRSENESELESIEGEIEAVGGGGGGDVVHPPASGYAGVKKHKFKIEVADVERLYEDWIIPLTKEVEVSIGLVGNDPPGSWDGKDPEWDREIDA